MTVYIDPATGELIRDAAPFQLFPALDTATEAALRASNAKFERRFARMEILAREQGVVLEALDLDAWEALWSRAKAQG